MIWNSLSLEHKSLLVIFEKWIIPRISCAYVLVRRTHLLNATDVTTINVFWCNESRFFFHFYIFNNDVFPDMLRYLLLSIIFLFNMNMWFCTDFLQGGRIGEKHGSNYIIVLFVHNIEANFIISALPDCFTKSFCRLLWSRVIKTRMSPHAFIYFWGYKYLKFLELGQTVSNSMATEECNERS